MYFLLKDFYDQIIPHIFSLTILSLTTSVALSANASIQVGKQDLGTLHKNHTGQSDTNALADDGSVAIRVAYIMKTSLYIKQHCEN